MVYDSGSYYKLLTPPSEIIVR